MKRIISSLLLVSALSITGMQATDKKDSPTLWANIECPYDALINLAKVWTLDSNDATMLRAINAIDALKKVVPVYSKLRSNTPAKLSITELKGNSLNKVVAIDSISTDIKNALELLTIDKNIKIYQNAAKLSRLNNPVSMTDKAILSALALIPALSAFALTTIASNKSKESTTDKDTSTNWLQTLSVTASILAKVAFPLYMNKIQKDRLAELDAATSDAA